MGAVNTTYTFTATDTITSTKMNNIIDETVMTSDACLSGGGLEVASGKLTISANAINSSRLAANSVSSSNIVDGTIVNADISPTAAIAGTKIAASFGNQNITATGDIGLEGTASDYTAAVLNNTSGVQTQLFSNANLNGGIVTVTNHPMLLATNNTERMRITAAGNVGVGKTNPSTPLDVNGTVTATAFSGPLTGNVTGIASGNIKQGGGTNQLANVVYVGWSGSSQLRVQVDSTDFGVNWPINVNGNASTATTATTVSNGAITAAKLDGAQSGSAPVYGCRAWVNFDGTRDSSGATNASNTNRFIRSSGNVTSVKKDSTGRYTITFTTPFPSGNTNYTVVCSTGNANSPRVASADRATATESSIQIETDDTASAAETCTENSVMVIA